MSSKRIHPGNSECPRLPGSRAGQSRRTHAAAEVHAGLVCLDSAFQLDLDTQQELFKHALEELADLPDLINQALEVYQNEDESISINLYEIPPQLG